MFKKFFNSALSLANDLAGKYYQSGNKTENNQKEDSEIKGQSKDFSRENQDNDFIQEKSRQQSLKNSQGNSDFSGSSYNGPGNVDHEKTNSNMAQRNY